MKLEKLLVKIRRRENPLFNTLYKVRDQLLSMDEILPPSFYRTLYDVRYGAQELREMVLLAAYHRPAFKSLCRSCGKNFRLDQPILPFVSGDLQLDVGDNCRFNGDGAFMANKVFDDPTITIGDNTYIGFKPTFNVAKRITIGSDVLISDVCVISDNPGHPTEIEKRLTESVRPDQVKPVTIEDGVWLAAGVTVLPGVTVGRGSIIGTQAVVSKDIPPNSLAVGNPAQVKRSLA